MSQDGLVIVIFAVDGETGELVGGPNVVTRGFIYVKESDDLISGARKIVNKTLENINGSMKDNWVLIKSMLRETLRHYLWQLTKRNPMILPLMVEARF